MWLAALLAVDPDIRVNVPAPCTGRQASIGAVGAEAASTQGPRSPACLPPLLTRISFTSGTAAVTCSPCPGSVRPPMR